MNSNIKHYFDIHGKTDKLFFTSDGLAFFGAADANSHANNLADKKVTPVTREEVAAWWATAAPEQLAAAVKELDAANEALSAAQANVAGLSNKSTVLQKAPYVRAVNEATNRVNAATLAVQIAQDAVDALGESGEQGAESEEAAAYVPGADEFAHVVTQEDLDNNPELVANGVQVGETIYIPKDDTQNTEAEIAEDVKTAVKTKAVKKAPVAKKKTATKKK